MVNGSGLPGFWNKDKYIIQRDLVIFLTSLSNSINLTKITQAQSNEKLFQLLSKIISNEYHCLTGDYSFNNRGLGVFNDLLTYIRMVGQLGFWDNIKQLNGMNI